MYDMHYELMGYAYAPCSNYKDYITTLTTNTKTPSCTTTLRTNAGEILDTVTLSWDDFCKYNDSIDKTKKQVEKWTVKEIPNHPTKWYKMPAVKRVVFNNPATIVFWEDGTKTVVKCMEGEEFSEYYGFVTAVAKKMFGNNNAICKIVEKYHVEDKKNAVCDNAEP